MEHAKEIESLRSTLEALKMNQKHCDSELEAAIMEKESALTNVQEVTFLVNKLENNLPSAQRAQGNE